MIPTQAFSTQAPILSLGGAQQHPKTLSSRVFTSQVFAILMLFARRGFVPTRPPTPYNWIHAAILVVQWRASESDDYATLLGWTVHRTTPLSDKTLQIGQGSVPNGGPL
jgi:hypothetical protein